MSAQLFARCADLIGEADALIIGAGAGMGVDSGLPDFRGPGGFWNIYPALGRAGLRFEEIANPEAFRRHPELAWGFYGHRLDLYRQTRPGPAFAMLREIADTLPYGAFVFTSNVDGHFQQAGFADERVCEIHGSIHHLQCLAPCSAALWSAKPFQPEVDQAACRLRNPPPTCPRCGGLARPNILMFGDDGWLSARTDQQQGALMRWRERVKRPLVIEIGAGMAIPTVRWFCEHQGAPLIRINPDAGDIPGEGVALAMGASAALQGITAVLAAA